MTLGADAEAGGHCWMDWVVSCILRKLCNCVSMKTDLMVRDVKFLCFECQSHKDF